MKFTTSSMDFSRLPEAAKASASSRYADAAAGDGFAYTLTLEGALVSRRPISAPAYLCFWSVDAFHIEADSYDVVDMAFFTDDLCYDDQDRAAISALAVGARWSSPDQGDWHTVERLA